MNSVARKFHRNLLIISLFMAAIGFGAMLYGMNHEDRSGFMFYGMITAYGFGALACIPLFYFSAQVAHKDGKQEGQKASDDRTEE